MSSQHMSRHMQHVAFQNSLNSNTTKTQAKLPKPPLSSLSGNRAVLKCVATAQAFRLGTQAKTCGDVRKLPHVMAEHGAVASGYPVLTKEFISVYEVVNPLPSDWSCSANRRWVGLLCYLP